MAALGGVSLLTLPGYFLFERFHFAAFYLPGVIFTGGVLLKTRNLSGPIMLILWLSPWIFLTLAIALQLTTGRAVFLVIGILIEALGQIPATILFYLLFVLEIIGIAKLITANRDSEREFSDFAMLRLKFLDILAFLGLLESENSFNSSKVEAVSDGGESISRAATAPNFHDEPLLRRVLTGEATDERKSPLPKISETWQAPPSRVPDGYFRHEGLSPPMAQEENSVELAESAINSTQAKSFAYEIPIEGLLEDYPDGNSRLIDDSTSRWAEILEQTLNEFKIKARVTGICKGPVITMYELLPSPGVKISSIVNLQDNIALRLAASRVRIVAPIPGKHAIGVEVPNKKTTIVSFSSLVKSDEFRNSNAMIPVILGQDVSGENQVVDLARTPHLLIAGATGSGKSVCVNSLIGSILYSRSHHEIKMIMVDPKIVELKLYNDIPHLLTPVITEPKRALQALKWCLTEMERRYSLLNSQGVRDMHTFNKKIKGKKLAMMPLPYIVVIIDEFADLMATSGKELEGIVARLAAMSRAVGIHLVLATQRPSVDVITGLIKANFPSRIAFMVAGKTDSRIIIDTVGAEKLLGRGDMLFTSAWNPFPFRMQGTFLAEEEIERVADYVKTLGKPDYIDEEIFTEDEDSSGFQLESDEGEDSMYKKALEIAIGARKVSASYLQRCLKIGYNRAARLVEEMENRGIVGPANGSKPRDVICIPDHEGV